ncbi:MAG: RagB/SusD family nutrient uptake outer membrane protein [Reichenbachiella sp.]
MMNKLKLIVSLVCLGSFYSCEEFLSPTPTVPEVDTYFTTEENLYEGVFNMYDGIQGINSTNVDDVHGIQLEYQITEMRSDNTRSKSGEGNASQFDRFEVEPTNGTVANYYRSYYNVIYRAHIVLENLDAATDQNRDAIEAEARFVRAYAYFNLVRLYGDIPLIEGIIGPGDLTTPYTRRPVADIYTLIKEDFNFAIQHLDNTHKNRASRAAAQTFLAKVHLIHQEYSEALALVNAVIASNRYSLEADFRDVFFQEDNSEVIFAIGFLPDNTDDSQNFSAEWLNAVGRSSGLNYVTDDAIVALEAFGGPLRTPYSYRNDAAQTSQNQVVKYVPNGDEQLGIDPTSNDPTLAGNDWIVLRYADVLLLHVEATMDTGESTTNPDALRHFRTVRNRAGIFSAVTSVTKEDLINERRVELAFENKRLFDLIRMGVAVETLLAFADANDFNFSAADLLLPIPQREINLSQGLMEQNPGY